MTDPRTTAEPGEATIWIDRDQAIIATHEADGSPKVERLGRGGSESETAFEVRAVDEVIDQDRVTVAGPVATRTSFERAYVAVTHRPDRITDVEPGIDAADVADHPARRLVP